MRKERVTPSDLERPLQFGVALGVPAPERPIQALASGSGWTFQLIVAVVFPFLFGFFAQFTSKPQAHAGLYDTPCEIAAIVTLVALLVYAFVRGASLSFNAMLLAVVALYSTGLLVFPWLYMEGSALAGVFIKCGFTVYNVLLWALLARKSFEDPRRTYLYYGVFLGFANVQYGRVAEAFLLDARAATPLLVSYLSIVFLWLIAICCLVLFLLYSRSESRGRSAHPAAVCVSSAEASAVEVDAFALRLEAFCRTAGLTKREREVLIEAIHGYSMDNIAKKLFISSETVRTHMKSIYHKAAVKGKQELVILIDSLPIGE